MVPDCSAANHGLILAYDIDIAAILPSVNAAYAYTLPTHPAVRYLYLSKLLHVPL